MTKRKSQEELAKQAWEYLDYALENPEPLVPDVDIFKHAKRKDVPDPRNIKLPFEVRPKMKDTDEIREIAEEILRLDDEAMPSPWKYTPGIHEEENVNSELITYYRNNAPTLARKVLQMLEVVEAAYMVQKDFESISDGFFSGLVPPQILPLCRALRKLEDSE